MHNLEYFDRSAVILDEGNRDGESFRMDSDTLDGAGRISRFSESIADCCATSRIFRKVDMLAPSDVVGVEEEGLEVPIFHNYVPKIDGIDVRE